MSFTTVRSPKSGEKFIAMIEIYGQSTASFKKKFDVFKKTLDAHFKEHFPGTVPTKAIVKHSGKRRKK
jgi:hypothetical protein